MIPKLHFFGGQTPYLHSWSCAILHILLVLVAIPVYSQQGTTTVSTAQLEALMKKVDALSEKVDSQQKEIARLKASNAAQPTVIPNDFSAPIGHRALQQPSAKSGKMIIEPKEKSDWFAEFESVWLRPLYNQPIAAVRIDPAPEEMVNFRNELEQSSRFSFGFRNPGGIGLRTSYWDFEQTSEETVTSVAGAGGADFALSVGFNSNGGDANIAADDADPVSISHTLEIGAFDFEATRRSNLGNWIIERSAGIRVGEQNHYFSAFEADRVDSFSWSTEFRGTGPSLGIHAVNPLGAGGLSLFAGGRGALLIGDVNSRLIDNGTLEFQDSELTYLTTLEARLGARYDRPLQQGFHFYFETAMEGQGWFGMLLPETRAGATTAGDAGNSGKEDLILFGVGVKAGVSREF